MTRRWLCIVVAMLCCLFAVAVSGRSEASWVLSFPDKETCEAFKEKAQAPSFAERKAERETGKASARTTYTCERAVQWERDKDGKLRRVPETVDPRGPKGK